MSRLAKMDFGEGTVTCPVLVRMGRSAPLRMDHVPALLASRDQTARTVALLAIMGRNAPSPANAPATPPVIPSMAPVYVHLDGEAATARRPVLQDLGEKTAPEAAIASMEGNAVL